MSSFFAWLSRLFLFIYKKSRDVEIRHRRYTKKDGPGGISFYVRNRPNINVEEDDYDELCTQARSEKVYQDLCNLNLTASSRSPVEPSFSITSTTSLTTVSSQSGTGLASVGACAQVSFFFKFFIFANYSLLAHLRACI